MPQVFAPFPTDPPPADQARAALYLAFAGYEIRWGWCMQCFAPEDMALMRAYPQTETAPLDAFSLVFSDHPDCSGGPETFLHWVPRGLEIGLQAGFTGSVFVDRLVQTRIIAWPAQEIAALRGYAARMAHDWFTSGRLPSDPPAEGRFWQDMFSEDLIALLTFLRFDPADLARWLVASDTALAWRALIGFLICPKLTDPVYFEPEDRDRIFADAGLALGRRLHAALAAAVTGQALLTARGRWADTDPGLAHDLAAAARDLPGWQPETDDPDRDLALIARAMAEGPGRA